MHHKIQGDDVCYRSTRVQKRLICFNDNSSTPVTCSRSRCKSSKCQVSSGKLLHFYTAPTVVYFTHLVSNFLSIH